MAARAPYFQSKTYKTSVLDLDHAAPAELGSVRLSDSPKVQTGNASVPVDNLNLNGRYCPSSYEPVQEPHNEMYKYQEATYKQGAQLEEDVENFQRQLKFQRYGQGNGSALVNVFNYNPEISKAQELIKEINFLEEEINILEHHALSLYRGLFNQCASPSTTDRLYTGDCPSPDRDGESIWHGRPYNETSKDLKEAHMKRENHRFEEASVPKESIVEVRPWPSYGLCDTIVVSHAQTSYPKKSLQSKLKNPEDKCCRTIAPFCSQDRPRLLKDFLSDTPNQLSEDLLQCMTGIYCKLRDPPVPSFGASDSPLSYTSLSTSLSSMHGVFSDGWSPGSRTSNGPDAPLLDPYQVKGNHQWVGPYSFMIEVSCISSEKERLNHASQMLRRFRSMIEQLDKVNPAQLKHSEKLAFWINIYNTLLMHAYLAYGIPRSNLKCISMLQRASYKIGGRSVTASMIAHNFLHCSFHRPTRWLQSLLQPVSKLKLGDERRAYSLDRSEPLLCFALCCGVHSDPAVRVYSPQNVHHELECAMKEFLQASIGIHNEKKVLLPKVLDWYAREADIPSIGMMDWVSQFVDPRERDLIQACIQAKRSKCPSHCIKWITYSYNFRYILHCDLTRFSLQMH